MGDSASSVSPDPLGLEGSVLDGRYRIERRIGQGGFGVVYRARHLRFDGPLAIKVLNVTHRPGCVDSLAEDFEQEGKILFSLGARHPAFVRVFECGTVLLRTGIGAPYLAMEWIEGVSLAEELKHRRAHGLPPLTLEEVMSIFQPAVEGLAAAHEHGIVHRDLKPAHFVIVNQGQRQTTKVLDFGLAKIVEKGASFPELLANTTGLRHTFTPAYGAPEQWRRELGATGPWTDVHTLAVVMVEALCGQMVFGGRTADAARARCLDPSRRPTPRDLGASVSDAVNAVFETALRVDPRERFRNAQSLWTSLGLAAEWKAEDHSLVELAAPASVSLELPSHASAPAHLLGPGVPEGRCSETAPPSFPAMRTVVCPGRAPGDADWASGNVEVTSCAPSLVAGRTVLPSRPGRRMAALGALGALLLTGAAMALFRWTGAPSHDATAPGPAESVLASATSAAHNAPEAVSTDEPAMPVPSASASAAAEPLPPLPRKNAGSPADTGKSTAAPPSPTTRESAGPANAPPPATTRPDTTALPNERK